MRAVRQLGRQRHHARPERGDDRQRLFRRLRREIRRRRASPRDRPASSRPACRRCGRAAPSTDRRMRHADPEQEPAAGLFGERALAVRHRHRVAGVDVGDARRDDQRFGVGEQPGRNAPARCGRGFPAATARHSPSLRPAARMRRLRPRVSTSIGAQTPSLPSCIARPDRLGSLPEAILAPIRADWARLHPDFCKAVFFARPGDGARRPTRRIGLVCAGGARDINRPHAHPVSHRLCRPGRVRTGHPAAAVLRRALRRLAARR